MLPHYHEWTLAGAGLLAGAMNALAGGGSFVTLPALIAAGLPSVQANASSTVALFPGGAAAALTYSPGLGPVGGVSLWWLVPVTLAGGLTGAALLLRTPTAAFDIILPWLLSLATFALCFGPRVGVWLRRRWRIGPVPVVCLQFALAGYGGYFGGAVGIMMVAVWNLLDRCDLKALNAPRTLLVSAANLMAVLTFVVRGTVRWPETVTVLVAATFGGFAGAWIGRRIPPRVLRAVTLTLAFCITALFFVRAGR